MSKPISVILAAHGSEASPLANEPLHDLAAAIKSLGHFDHVTPAFLIGQPLMSNVLESLPPGDVIVVPVMTSEGYYLNKLPETFQANANFDQFNFSIAPVVGLHPVLADAMSQRLTGFLLEHKLEPADTTIVVIGHGTRRNKTSGATTYALADNLKAKHPTLEFKVAFLDQDPEVAIVADSISTANVIVLPFLVSRGPHMTQDVPAAFGLPTGHAIEFPLIAKRESKQGESENGKSKSRQGITLCDGPLACFDAMPSVIVQMANCRKTCSEPLLRCNKNCQATCSLQDGGTARLGTAKVAVSDEHGCVYLIGAGPGDPELITVRGMKLLQRAQVVIYDRLIPFELLQWCQDDTIKIDVGKYPQHHRISQAEINHLLVAHAQQGKTVVRLKGGDPFVFGRGTEEIAACRAAGIPCHVVPGVSSAIAAPMAAGIPVTSRGVARSFMVVTGQTAPELADHKINLKAMARTDTVVLLMARKNLRTITEGLIAAGRSADTPVACIERATFSDQRVTYSTLHGIADQVEILEIRNPMVTVIGEVAAMVDPKLIDWPGESSDHFYAYDFGE